MRVASVVANEGGEQAGLTERWRTVEGTAGSRSSSPPETGRIQAMAQPRPSWLLCPPSSAGRRRLPPVVPG